MGYSLKTEQMMVRFFLIVLLLPALAWGQVNDSQMDVSSDNPVTIGEKPVAFSSYEGNFRITFPSGCGKVVTRVPSEELPDVDGLPAVKITATYCDRFEKKGEGCSVTSYFNVTNDEGGYPESQQVIDRVLKFLKSMSVTIQKQLPVSKEFPDGTIIEGLDVFASESSGSGQAWVRGLIYEGDIYILSAWKSTGDLWSNPEFVTFFNSFQPGTD